MQAVRTLSLATLFAATLAACGGGGGGGGGSDGALGTGGTLAAGSPAASPGVAPAPSPAASPAAPGAAPAPAHDGATPPAPAPTPVQHGFDPVLVAEDVSPQTPALARLTTGGKVIAWSTDNGRRVWAQKTTATGALVGTPILVNTPNTEVVPGFSVAATRDGGFVVAYAFSVQQPTTPFSTVLAIQARRYANDGTLLGDTRVTDQIPNSISNGNFYSITRGPVIKPTADGGFVVGWNGRSARPAPIWSYFQRLSADGARVGPQVQPDPGSFQADQLTLAPLPDGTVVAVWQQEVSLSTGRIYRIYNRRFGTDSAPLTPPTEYAGTLSPNPFPIGAAALAGGNVALAWAGPDDGADPRKVFSTVITPEGSSAATITPTEGPREAVTDVAVVPLGNGFGALWQSAAGFPRGVVSRIGIRRFDEGGFAIDAPSLLVQRNTSTVSATTGASATAGTGFTAVGGQDGNLIAIFQQAAGTRADAYLVAR